MTAADVSPPRPPHAPEATLTIDRDAYVVGANAAACALLGVSERELGRAPLLARVAVPAQREAAQLFMRGFHERIVEGLIPFICDAAPTRYCMVRVVPVRRDDGVSVVTLVLRDATAAERHRDATQDTPAAPASTEASVPRSSPAVMIIDDDAGVRAMMRRSLERAGHDVLEASSGRAALGLLRGGERVHYIVTDLKMADGSGGWLLAQLGYEYPELLPRTIVTSGEAEGAGAAHVATRWRCPVLAKPFTGATLLDTLMRLAEGRAGVT